MDVSTFQQLLSSQGQQTIAEAGALNPIEETFLACVTKLQKQYPSSLAKAALETVIFRQKARAKFSRAEAMYFTRDGLEMASGEIISRYRAARFAPYEYLLDLGCGIGGDTIGLAGEGRDVTGVDLNLLHLALAWHNLAAYGLKADFVSADLTQLTLPTADAAFFDPGRRVDGRRKFSVHQYQPSLGIIRSWLPSLKALGVKISPGVDLSEIAEYDCEVEFISLNGDLKECVLWFGEAKTIGRRATLLGMGSSPISFISSSSLEPSAPLSLPLAYLYEPDPAILRAGLVTQLAEQLGAAQLDPDIAYLTSDTLRPTPFARAFAIEAHLPFSQKRLREQLRAMNVGRVTVKKRGSPLEVDTLARDLKLKGDEERIVFLTHVNGKAWVLIGKAVEGDRVR